MGWYMASLEVTKGPEDTAQGIRGTRGRGEKHSQWERRGEELSTETSHLSPPHNCSELSGSPLAYMQTPTVQEQPADTPTGPAPGSW